MPNRARVFRTVLLAAVLAGAVHAEIRLPALISDHMLLQQGAPVRIWGTADPGEAIEVSFRDQKVPAMTGQEGRWLIWLKAMPAGGPHDMVIRGSNTVTVRDVLVGEVWVGSGQSNMAWTVARSNNAEREIAQSANPSIRLFQAERAVADTPRDEIKGAWAVCGPESVKDFSAVGYFFAREIQRARRVPVGLIHSSWGGTSAQAWTSRPALEADPLLMPYLDRWQQVLERYPFAKARYEKQLAEWKPDSGTPQPRPPAGPGHQGTPGGLYNAMIAPLTRYAIRGVIWYQGESNAGEAEAYNYRRLFRTLIEDWRQAWGLGDFPFLFVQLANFETKGLWPVLRESQTHTLSLRNTGMAVAIDIGDSKDIHPRNKQEVGRRLALAARRVAYGEDIVYSGPIFRHLSYEDGQLHVWFDHAAGLRARDGKLTGFEVAGDDGVYYPAEAQIKGEAVMLTSLFVVRPLSVRYGWANDPACNLVNGAGLPASPFRAGEPEER